MIKYRKVYLFGFIPFGEKIDFEATVKGWAEDTQKIIQSYLEKHV